jgi:hypothetical protein
MTDKAEYNNSCKRSRNGKYSSNSNWVTRYMTSAFTTNETTFTDCTKHDTKQTQNTTMDEIMTKTSNVTMDTLDEMLDKKIDAIISEKICTKVNTYFEKLIGIKFENITTEIKMIMEQNSEAIKHVNTNITYNENKLKDRLEAMNEVIELNKESQTFELKAHIANTQKHYEQINKKKIHQSLTGIDQKVDKIYELVTALKLTQAKNYISPTLSTDKAVKHDVKYAVKHYIELEGNKSEVGAYILKCISHLGTKYGEEAIRKSVEELVAEGLIYSTATDEYYKIAIDVKSEDHNL